MLFLSMFSYFSTANILSTHFEQYVLLDAMEDAKLNKLLAVCMLVRGARKSTKGLS